MKQLHFLIALTVLLTVAAAPAALAQRPVGDSGSADGAGSELARMREAAAREAAGDLHGAEAIVRQVLAANPSSLTALLAYERLLNVQGRIGEVLPVVERLIRLEPASAIGHQVRLRVQAQLDDAAGLETAVNGWIRATPHIETPYREASLVWRQRGDMRRAIAVLEQGRQRIDRPDALALELGDAHAAAGDFRRAAAEWARAVGPDGRGLQLVQRRIHGQADGGARALPQLVDELARTNPTVGRQRAAAVLAIEAGLEIPARRLADQLAAALPRQEREPVLVELGRRADAAGLYRIAAWAYTEMLKDAQDTGSTLALRTRLAELALLAGDTALATDVYRQLETASAAGSPQRRQAMALRLQLTIREGDLDGAAAGLAAFRREYPQAPETDATAAMLAMARLEKGETTAAEQSLAGVSGPRSSHVRGRLHIRNGDLAQARDELLAAAPLLHGREATETISLAALLVRLSPRGGDLVARAAAATDVERERMLRGAVEETKTLPAPERAAVLDFMAAMADAAGLTDDADAMRQEIVDALPRTPEAASSLLALARRAAGGADSMDEAVVLLERLILEYPRSALAPQARRELERLHARRSMP
jgi:TolA-binding protein